MRHRNWGHCALWREDLKKNPIGGYQFSRQTPPLRDMDIYSLTPANSKRQEMVSLYADIDGFTAYVADHINEKTDDVEQAGGVGHGHLGGKFAHHLRSSGDLADGLFFHAQAHGQRGDHHTHDHAHESPTVMLVPLGVLALGAVFSGMIWYNSFFGDEAKMNAWFGMEAAVDHAAEAKEARWGSAGRSACRRAWCRAGY